MLKIPNQEAPREMQYLMPPGMKPRSGSIMRRRSSVRKKSNSVTFALDVPMDRRGSFRTSVKRRMSVSRRSIGSRKLSKSEPNKVANMRVVKGIDNSQTWKSRAFGEKNYLALKKLAVILQDRRESNSKKEIDFQSWSKKQQQKQHETIKQDNQITNFVESKHYMIRSGKGKELLVILKNEEKRKWIKMFLNGLFLTTGLSLLAAVLIVIVYTSFVQNDVTRYRHHHHQHLPKRKQATTLNIFTGDSILQLEGRLSNATLNDRVHNSTHSVVNGSNGNEKNKEKSPCVGVPLIFGNNPVVISLLCSSS